MIVRLLVWPVVGLPMLMIRRPRLGLFIVVAFILLLTQF
jgi:hypothetical protein